MFSKRRGNRRLQRPRKVPPLFARFLYPGFCAAVFVSRFSIASRRMDLAKEELTVIWGDFLGATSKVEQEAPPNLAYRCSSGPLPVLGLIGQITGRHHKEQKEKVVVLRITIKTICQQNKQNQNKQRYKRLFVGNITANQCEHVKRS